MEEVRAFDEMQFYAFIKAQAAVIRGQELDNEQGTYLLNTLRIAYQTWAIQAPKKKMLDMQGQHEALFEFVLALQIAYSNYRSKNKTFWSNIFGYGISKINPMEVVNSITKIK